MVRRSSSLAAPPFSWAGPGSSLTEPGSSCEYAAVHETSNRMMISVVFHPLIGSLPQAGLLTGTPCCVCQVLQICSKNMVFLVLPGCGVEPRWLGAAPQFC